MANSQIHNGFHANPQSINTDRKWVLAVVGGNILVPAKSDGVDSVVIDHESADQLKFFCQRRLQMGQFQGLDCQVWELMSEATAVEDFNLVELRSLLVGADEQQFTMACRAVQLLDWQDSHQFCGRCGQAMQCADTEHAMRCESCDISHYPRISPCIIAVVTKGDHCLLARQPSWPEGMFSALAGFIEAGESAEQAVHREIFEEVGIEVTNIRYVSSQSWPFPGQLMLGYIVEAVTDDIQIDGEEISEAGWFRYDQLPSFVPPSTIMSGQLIQQFIDEASGKT